MDTLTHVLKPLWFVNLACLVVLLFRSTRLGIFARYPALLIYLYIDLSLGMIGLSFGLGSLIYWWSYFVLSRLLGSVVLILMSREIFVEIYFYHPGLRQMTIATLRNSVILGIVGTLLLVPLALIHWGDPGFRCWQLPFYELGRSLIFGQVFFIVSMWNKLRWLPLKIHKNVKTYSLTLGLYQTVNGLLMTMILIMHSPRFHTASNVIVLLTSSAFYAMLALALQRPEDIPLPRCCPVPDPQLIARLSHVDDLLNEIESRTERGRALALQRFRARYLSIRMARRSNEPT